jgi:hypothetical protein
VTDAPAITLTPILAQPYVDAGVLPPVVVSLLGVGVSPLVSLSAQSFGLTLSPTVGEVLARLTQQDTGETIEIVLSPSSGPVVSVSTASGAGFDASAAAVQIALQAFMVGPPGATPEVVITAHAISADQQPTVTAGGTPLNPTFDMGIPSASVFHIDEFVAVSAGEIRRTYGLAPSNSTKVFINGLRKSGASFTILGNQIILPADLQITPGDAVAVEY